MKRFRRCGVKRRWSLVDAGILTRVRARFDPLQHCLRFLVEARGVDALALRKIGRHFAQGLAKLARGAERVAAAVMVEAHGDMNE